jgi:sulfate permease, SulP family
MVNRQTLRADLIAGIVGGLVVLPQGVAFATLAGMPPQYGLYCAMLPAIIAALFGSSLHAVTGPTNAVSMIVFATIAPLAVPESDRYVALVLTLALMSGVMMLVLGAFKLGKLVNWIDHAVVLGFTSAVGLLIAVNQLAAFTGVPLTRGAGLVNTLSQFVAQVGSINAAILTVGSITVLAGLAAKRWLPDVPAMLVAMVAGVAAGASVGLVWPGVRVPMLGALAGGLPPLSMPLFDLGTWRLLLGAALAVTLLSLVEAVSIGRAIAIKSGQQIDGNQEFVGQGLANMSAAFFSGYPCSASFNRSGLNYEAGAKTPLASVFAAFVLLGVLMFVAGWARYLPLAATAGILLLVAYGLLHIDEVRALFKGPRTDIAVFMVTFLSTLLLNLEAAIAVGVAFSLLIKRFAKP